MGIGLELWRQRIGRFSPGRSVWRHFSNTPCSTSFANNVNLLGSYTCKIECKNLCLHLLLIGLLLICCGDIEINPGPTSRQQPKEDFSAILQQINDNLAQLNSKVDMIAHDLSVLKAQIDNVEDFQNALEAENEELRLKIRELEENNDKLESQSRRENLLFYGIPESENESWKDTENKVNDILKSIDIDPTPIVIQRCHRLTSTAKPRPVIVKFLRFKDRELIFSEAMKKLKSTPYRVSEDFTKRIRELRKKLMPFLKEARDDGKRAFIRFDKLIIDGTVFAWDSAHNKIKRTQ